MIMKITYALLLVYIDDGMAGDAANDVVCGKVEKQD